jgi:chromosome segregation ATPase
MPFKRKAPAPKKGSKKQQKVEVVEEKDEFTVKSELVIEALQNEKYAVPGTESNRTMLVKIIENCTNLFAQDRHEWQVKMMECVHQALLVVRADLDKEVADIQLLLDTNESKLNELEGARLAAEENVRVKDEALSQAQELQSSRVEALKEAKQIKEESEEIEEEIIEDLVEKKERKDLLRKGAEEMFSVLVAGTCEDPADLIAALQEVLATMNLDESLSACAPTALGRPVDNRGAFDKMSLDYIDCQFKEQRAALDQAIADAEARLATQKETVEAKNLAWNQAQETRDSSKEHVAASKAAKTEANQGLKAAEKAIKEHNKSISSASDDMEEAKGEVATFQAIQDAFIWLHNRNPEPEHVEEPVSIVEDCPEVAPKEDVVQFEVLPEAIAEDDMVEGMCVEVM